MLVLQVFTILIVIIPFAINSGKKLFRIYLYKKNEVHTTTVNAGYRVKISYSIVELSIKKAHKAIV